MKKILILIFALFLVVWCGKKDTSNQTGTNSTPVVSQEKIDKMVENTIKQNPQSTKKIWKVINLWGGLEKDDKNVYYNWYQISWADSKYFQIVFSWNNWIYGKDKNTLFVFKNGLFSQTTVDPTNFKLIEYWYGKDKKNIYAPTKQWLEPISGADISSFQILNWKFSKDKNNIYVSNQNIKDGDPATFQILWGNNWITYAKDKKNIYFWWDYSYEVLEWSDYNTFQVFTGGYAKDKNNAYWSATIIKWADASTFKMIDWDYAKDKNNVYRMGNIIKWADAATFQLINNNYAKDKNNVYLVGDIIKWANPKTFKP